jgi:putative transcriptional regulator
MKLTNHFLIAQVALKSTVFADSVVYVTEHSEYIGAVGVVINKPLSNSLANVFENIDIADYNKNWLQNNLYWGGPVKPSNGFFLRQTNELEPSELECTKFELTGNKDYLTELTARNNLFMSIGYSMWNPTQLENEILNNDWIVTQSIPEIIFNVSPEQRYSEALKTVGIRDMSRLCGNTEFFTVM